MILEDIKSGKIPAGFEFLAIDAKKNGLNDIKQASLWLDNTSGDFFPLDSYLKEA